MIFTVLSYIFGGIITAIAMLLDYITILHWPDNVLSGIEYFSSTIMNFNSIFPIFEIFEIINFNIIFFPSYYFIYIIIKLFTKKDVAI